jgi:hypothetical protein
MRFFYTCICKACFSSLLGFKKWTLFRSDVCKAFIVEGEERKKKTSWKRRWRTHPTLSHCLSIGNFHTSFNNHRIYPEKFFQNYRMSVTSFDELLGLIGENIVKQDTIMRQSIHPAGRLVICWGKSKLTSIYDFIGAYCVQCCCIQHSMFDMELPDFRSGLLLCWL